VYTSAIPEQIKKCFSGRDAADLIADDGALTAIAGNEKIVFRNFKNEKHATYHKRPANTAYSYSLIEELSNMDFTINSMAYNERAGIIDNFGGLNDIFHRKVACIGDPAIRFNQKPVRIMKALRTAAVLGFEIDGITSLAMHDFRKLLLHISPKRLVREFDIFLTELSSASYLIDYADVIAALIPEITPCVGFDQKSSLYIYDVWTHTAIAIENSPHDRDIRLALLLHDLAKPECFSLDEDGSGQFINHEKLGVEKARGILNRLGYDGKTADCVTTLINYHYVMIIDDYKTIRYMLAMLGKENFLKLNDMMKSNNKARNNLFSSNVGQLKNIRDIAVKIIEDNEYIDLETLAISSADVSAMGFSGRNIGEILNMLLMDVIDGKVENNREALIDRINKLFKDNRF